MKRILINITLCSLFILSMPALGMRRVVNKLPKLPSLPALAHSASKIRTNQLRQPSCAQSFNALQQNPAVKVQPQKTSTLKPLPKYQPLFQVATPVKSVQKSSAFKQQAQLFRQAEETRKKQAKSGSFLDSMVKKHINAGSQTPAQLSVPRPFASQPVAPASSALVPVKKAAPVGSSLAHVPRQRREIPFTPVLLTPSEMAIIKVTPKMDQGSQALVPVKTPMTVLQTQAQKTARSKKTTSRIPYTRGYKFNKSKAAKIAGATTGAGLMLYLASSDKNDKKAIVVSQAEFSQNSQLITLQEQAKEYGLDLALIPVNGLPSELKMSGDQDVQVIRNQAQDVMAILLGKTLTINGQQFYPAALAKTVIAQLPNKAVVDEHGNHVFSLVNGLDRHALGFQPQEEPKAATAQQALTLDVSPQGEEKEANVQIMPGISDDETMMPAANSSKSMTVHVPVPASNADAAMDLKHHSTDQAPVQKGLRKDQELLSPSEQVALEHGPEIIDALDSNQLLKIEWAENYGSQPFRRIITAYNLLCGTGHLRYIQKSKVRISKLILDLVRNVERKTGQQILPTQVN